MRVYYIKETDLWFIIVREKDEEIEEYLSLNWKRINKEIWARTFYTKDSALSALVIAKAKWKKGKTESISIEDLDWKKEAVKSYWWEFW